MSQLDTESSERVLHWNQCRPVVPVTMGLIFVAIVFVAAVRGWYQQRVVDHLESIGANVSLKSGFPYVGVHSSQDLCTFLEEAEDDLRYLARRGSLSLGISGSVSDADLRRLAEFGVSNNIDLRGCKATEEGVDHLRQSLPYGKVFWESPDDVN